MTAKDTLAALLPCPFCGSAARLYQVDHWIKVSCASTSCGVATGRYGSEQAATAAWNRRASTPPPGVGGEVEQEMREMREWLAHFNANRDAHIAVTHEDGRRIIDWLEKNGPRLYAALGQGEK